METLNDDDGFDSGRLPKSAQPPATGPKPIGKRTRPNGEEYHPRHIGHLEDLALLRDAWIRGRHVLIGGPPGSGKTACAQAAFASHDGPGLYMIAGNGNTEVEDLVGGWQPDPSVAGGYSWRPGPLTKSIIDGKPLLIDEIALIPPEVLAVLYEPMDGRGVFRVPTRPDWAPLPIAPGWFVVATYNPDVPGAQMSDALRDRFSLHVEVTTDWSMARDLGVPSTFVKLAQNLDERRQHGEVSWQIELRTLLDARDIAKDYGDAFAVNNLLAKVPPEHRDVVQELARTLWPKAKPAASGGRFGA